MVIVVGSGAGGATIAMELAKSGMPVTIIEKGPYIEPKKAHKCYETLKTNLDLLKTVCVGGTTLVSAGNAVRSSEDVLKDMGIDLREEFDEVERELNVNALPDSHFGNGTKKIMYAAKSLGFDIKKMPKFIDPEQCEPCGNCSFGCPNDAKWTAIKFIEEAKKFGVKIIENTPVTDLLAIKGEIMGVRSYDKVFTSDIVILSPGAVETPRLLRKTGIKAGVSFFMDTFVTVGGILRDIEFNEEVQMNALIEFDDFILSPHFSNYLLQELQKFGASKKDIIGIMVKIKDETSGRVTEKKVIKNNTLNDVKFLARGSAIAGSILAEAGVDPKTFVSTHPRGAHPGGTAPIGKVVDKNLETEINGLFVVDASVFPTSPGVPPILTIIALAKRLAKYLKD
ncbi:MAG: GMC family oxidoreductase [Euryarchaeota archaeon]|nr:GMC family oxidoreductase [Euryarchaeota archaeon]